MRIEVDLDQMGPILSKMQMNLEDMRTALSRLSSLDGVLSDMWDSPAKMLYDLRCRSDLHTLRQGITDMDKRIEAIRDCMAEYESGEQELKRG